MKIRLKLILLLLFASLAPMLVVVAADIASTKRFAQEQVDRAAAGELDEAKSDLLRIVTEGARGIEQRREVIEVLVSLQAATLETRLGREAPAMTGELYTPTDFDDPSRRPVGTTEWPGVHDTLGPDGVRRALPISLTSPVFVPAAGLPIEDASVRADAARMGTLVPAMRAAAEELGTLAASQYACLESGLHMSYPGKGGFPASYDGRTRDWYEAARDAGTMVWLPPAEDAVTGRMRATCARPVYGVDGRFAGVVAADIDLLGFLGPIGPPARLATGAETLLIASEAGGDGFEVRAATDAAGAWHAPSEPRTLVLAGEGLDEAARNIGLGRSGVSEKLSVNGRPVIAGYGEITGRVSLLILLRRSAVESRAAAIGEDLRSQVIDQLNLVVTAAILVAVISALVAFAAAKAVTIPMRRLVQAVDAVASGDFAARAAVRGRDEIGRLARAFNEMVPAVGQAAQKQQSDAIAEHVRRDLRPDEAPELPRFDVAMRCEACETAGGDHIDFIDLSQHRDGRWAIVVGDVVGQGLQAALDLAGARAAVRAHAEACADPAEAAIRAGRTLAGHFRAGRYLSLFKMTIDADPAAGQPELRWTNAGHEPAVLVEPGRDPELLEDGGPPLGVDPEFPLEVGSHAACPPGTVIYLGTDGVRTARNPREDEFGRGRVMDIIAANIDKPADAIADAIASAISEFREDAEPESDAIILVLKRRAD